MTSSISAAATSTLRMISLFPSTWPFVSPIAAKIRPGATEEEAEAIVKPDYLPPNEQTRIDPAPDLKDDNTISLLKGHKLALLEHCTAANDTLVGYEWSAVMSITPKVTRRKKDGHMIAEVKWGPKDKRNVDLSDGKKYLIDWVLLTETYDAPAQKKPAKKRKIAQTGGPAQKK